MNRRKFISLTGLLSTIWLPIPVKAALNSSNPVAAIPTLVSHRSDAIASVDEHPIVKVVGVGGMGTNGVDYLTQNERSGVDFICVDSDSKTVRRSIAQTKILLDAGISTPGRAGQVYSLSEKQRRDIAGVLNGAHLVFIVAGMGGATGTGVASEIATLARSLGALTLAVVTTPFGFEAEERNRRAAVGIAALEQSADSVCVVPNETLFRKLDVGLGRIESVQTVNKVIMGAVADLTDSLCCPGIVNLAMVDVQRAISGMGRGAIGCALASGHDRAFTAATKALELVRLLSPGENRPDRIIINITASSLKLKEVHDVMETIGRHASTDYFRVFGATVDPDLKGQLRVSLISFSAIGDRRQAI